MTDMSPEELIRQFWQAFDEARFDDIRPFLATNFIAVWPQTGESIRGAGNFISLNTHYPGRWRCHVKEILHQDDRVVSRVEITDGETVVYATSFFTIVDGLIFHAREFFADPGEPPFERSQWTEPLD